jgi:pyridoxine 4-dehydrogenase
MGMIKADVGFSQIHWPDIIQPFKGLGIEEVKDERYWDGIAECYKRGLIKNVGVSNYGAELLERAHSSLAARGVPIASNQINYSLMYRKSGAQATVDKGRELGVQTIGYFPLANGLLAGQYGPDSMPKFPKSLTMKKYIEGGQPATPTCR